MRYVCGGALEIEKYYIVIVIIINHEGTIADELITLASSRIAF